MRAPFDLVTRLLNRSGPGAGGEREALSSLGRGRLVEKPGFYRRWAIAQARATGRPDAERLRVLLTSPRALCGGAASPWVPVRRAALDALAGHTGPETVLTLLASLQVEPEESLRRLAGEVLVACGSEAIYPALGAVERSDAWTIEGMGGLILLLPRLVADGPSRGAAATLLTRVLRGEVPRRPKRLALRSLKIGWAAGAVLCGLLCVRAQAVLLAGPDYLIGATAVAIVVFLASAAAGFFLTIPEELWERSELRGPARDALITLDDPTPLFTLIQLGLVNTRLEGRQEARAVLRHLLAAVQNFDPALQQYAMDLCYGLDKRDPAMTLVVLRTLEHVGGSLQVEPVRRVAGWKHQPEVAAEASRVLAVLEQRAREEQAPSSLMRAGAAPPETRSTLLRPGTGAGQDSPESLLHVLGDAE